MTGHGEDRLEQLPGIGPSLASDLRDLGFRRPADLRHRDPEGMYRDLCKLRGVKIDRCVLYAFRCAVHAAGTDAVEPELRKWWNWKDRKVQGP